MNDEIYGAAVHEAGDILPLGHRDRRPARRLSASTAIVLQVRQRSKKAPTFPWSTILPSAPLAMTRNR